MKTLIKIGRDDSNDIAINEPRVSRNHAIITYLGNDTFEVKDLASTNGTFINGNRITQEKIVPGDKLEVAGCLVDWYPAFKYPREGFPLSEIQEEPFSRIRKTILVGSSKKNDIVVSNDFISGVHAKISLLKNGNFYIQDLGSINGTYVNGNKVLSKNFIKTDVIKLASVDLPKNWFQNKKLKTNIVKDNKKKIIISISLLVIISGITLIYINRCKWFDYDCNLSLQQISMMNNNTIVHIEHDYYYTIEFNGTTFYVGKNKLFKGTEANTSKENLLPYNSVSGSGCFIKNDGTILTSPFLIYPWVNQQEINNMLQEVITSRTIEHFSLSKPYKICGETADLKWIGNGSVNSPQNYMTATATKACEINDSSSVTIHSIQRSLPKNANLVSYYFDMESLNPLHNTNLLYYSFINPLRRNEVIKDTFYSAKLTQNINQMITCPLNKFLPILPEGSIVLNERGELIGIVEQQNVVFLPRFYKQIIN